MPQLVPDKFVLRTLRFLLLRIVRLLQCDYVVPDNTSLEDLLRVFICHVYLARGRQRRLPSYDYDKDDPYNRGILFWEEEKRLEYPVPRPALDFQGPQELLLTACRTSGELLVLRFVRASRRQAEVNIFLRDSEGRAFSSPSCGNEPLFLDISNGNKFQAGGLRMQCIEPMRKWRIAFNGLLVNTETGATAYVRFAFLWFALSHISDWTCDIPARRLFKFCYDPKTNEKLSETVANLEKCCEYLNGYEETGYCVGSVRVSFKGNASDEAEESEQELHMRGNFLRISHSIQSRSSPVKLKGFNHSFIYSKKGHLLQLSTLEFDNGRGLAFGSFLSTPGFKDPVETIQNEHGTEASLDDILYAPKLKFSTFELSHEVLRSEGSVQSRFKSQLCLSNDVQISKFDALLDNIPAIGLSIQGLIARNPCDYGSKPPLNILDHAAAPVPAPHVVSLGDPLCKNSALTGGKGSSLAVLTELSTLSDGLSGFSVPKGVVVTTEAFRRFLQSPAMYSMKKDLSRVLEATSVEEVKEICDQCIGNVKKEPVPKLISIDILQNLYNIFPGLSERRFAVRSSCSGEDSEDMSAAGQMETFLGVKGEQQILQSVLRCWASQFSHVAIEYKKRYGQELVSDMAVVIMEMVPADSAGVMFTCDPLTGDPSTIYITSNFGLGESVVSAMADPDTIRMSRDINGNLAVEEVTVGKKDVKIVMAEAGGGTRAENVTDSNASSLSATQAELLAKVGANIERSYGDWRDVEWAFAGDTLYILQARPVTFMDKASDLEIATDFEVPARAESCGYSRANLGEVLNGAISPLSIKMFNRVLSIATERGKGELARLRRCNVTPYCDSLLKLARHQYFFDLSEALRMLIPDPTNKGQVEALMLNFCGRVVDDDELYEEMGDTTDKRPHIPWWARTKEQLKMKYFAKQGFLFNRYLLRRKVKYPKNEMTAQQLFDGFIKANNLTTDHCARTHMDSSNGSSLWTSRIVEYLREVTDESLEKIYGEMSRLLASADDVISCEVPKKLENLANLISSEIGREKFLECSVEEASTVLDDVDRYPDSAAEFRRCLKEFGHRGYNEFDIYRKPWDMDANPLIATLQTMMRTQLDGTPKPHESVFESIRAMHCRLTPWQKLRLATIVHFSRKAIGVRENTKSLWIWSQNVTRKWAWALAKKMKQEGRLPDEELLFFCTPAELDDLLRNRNPAVISRAFDRMKLFPELASQEFREYFRGIPRPAPEPLPVFENGVVQMKGFPISKGRIQAKARVINKLEEAVQIQKGEILVTNATDIGWSPYFPMLGGVVTELGGLMSHGAVVAREYGLPCVVGLLGATKIFRSGDVVLLDGSQGLLVRIEETTQAQA